MHGLRVGYFPAWMDETPATDVDRAALETVKKLGMTGRGLAAQLALRLARPDPLRRSRRRLRRAHALRDGSTNSRCRSPTPGPTTSASRASSPPSISSRPTASAARSRERDGEHLSKVDLLLVPSLRDEMLTITNFTGHPSLTLRAGFVEVCQARSDWAPDPKHPLPKFSPPRRVPHGVTLIGRLFDEGLLGRVGVALERAFNVSAERPKGF